MNKAKILAAAAVIAITATACGGEQFDDAPVGIVDDSAVFVMTNADGFPNIAVRCYEGVTIFTTTRDYGDAVNIVGDTANPGPGCEDGDPVPKGETGTAPTPLEDGD